VGRVETRSFSREEDGEVERETAAREDVRLLAVVGEGRSLPHAAAGM